MNEKISNSISKLLPPELKIAKELINKLLEDKPQQRLTNLEYLERNKKIVCPIDKDHHRVHAKIKVTNFAINYGVIITLHFFSFVLP